MHTVFRTPHHDHIQKMKYIFQQVNPSENNSPYTIIFTLIQSKSAAFLSPLVS